MMLPHPARRRRRLLSSDTLPHRARTGASRGQSAVEFALILPIFALLMVIAVDFGRVFFSYVQITNAAREAAAYGAQRPTDPDVDGNGVGDEIEARAAQEINIQGGQKGEGGMELAQECHDAGGATISCADAENGSSVGNTITISVSEDFTFLTPLANSFFNDAFTMSASATSTVLGWAAASGGTGSPPGPCSLPVASFDVVTDATLTVTVDPQNSTPNSPGDPCNISGYNWDWGDGTTGVGNATSSDYTYATAGTYTITLEVTNQAGSSTLAKTVTVPDTGAPPCAPPVANFTWTSSGKTRTYSDASTVADPVNCPIVSWLWTFHDDTPPAGGSQSNAQNPAPVTYGNNSAHAVTLEVTNAGGTTSITKNS